MNVFLRQRGVDILLGLADQIEDLHDFIMESHLNVDGLAGVDLLLQFCFVIFVDGSLGREQRSFLENQLIAVPCENVEGVEGDEEVLLVGAFIFEIEVEHFDERHESHQVHVEVVVGEEFLVGTHVRIHSHNLHVCDHHFANLLGLLLVLDLILEEGHVLLVLNEQLIVIKGLL